MVSRHRITFDIRVHKEGDKQFLTDHIATVLRAHANALQEDVRKRGPMTSGHGPWTNTYNFEEFEDVTVFSNVKWERLESEDGPNKTRDQVGQ